MRTKTIFLLVALVLVSTSWVSEGDSLETRTHQYLNQQVANRTINGFSLDSYLKNNLGFQNGAQESISGYSEILKKTNGTKSFHVGGRRRRQRR